MLRNACWFRLITAIACLFSLSTLTAATFPLQWRWANPAPHGGNVFDMAYGFGLTVQVCERGQIFMSDDLVTWLPANSGTTNSLRGVTFFGSRLVATGEKGTVVYTDDLETFISTNLNTADWLESVAASSDLVVAVGDNASIYASTNGASWAKQTVPFTNWLRSVAYANNVFVAVGESGLIATRANNGTWTTRNSGTTRHLNKVVSIENQFRVTGENGVSLVGNAAGTSWSAVSGIGTTNALYSVAGTSNSLLLAGDKEVRFQTNGGAWSSQTATNLSSPAPVWTYYDALWEGSLYFIAGRSGMMVEGFSTNASASSLTWVDRFESLRTWIWDLVALTNLYVAVGDRGAIVTSTDGVNWDLEAVPTSLTNTVFLGVGGTTNSLLAVGNRGAIAFSRNSLVDVLTTNLNGSIITNTATTLGVDWRAAAAVTTNDLQGVAVFGNLFVACGAGGTILTSTNGTNWSARVSGTTAFLSSVVAYTNLLVACGDNGVILTSTNGTNWSARVSGTTNWIYRMKHLNGGLIGVGENGVILTSANGTNWTLRNSGTTRWLNAVTHASGHYFVAGNQGTLLTSANSITWTNIGTATQKSLYGIASKDGQQLVLAGIEGSIVRSTLTPMLDPVKILNYARISNQNLILVSGKTDQRFQLQHSTNLTDWTDGATVEIVDRSGTLLLLENADTNILSRDFIRAKVQP